MFCAGQPSQKLTYFETHGPLKVVLNTDPKLYPQKNTLTYKLLAIMKPKGSQHGIQMGTKVRLVSGMPDVSFCCYLLHLSHMGLSGRSRKSSKILLESRTLSKPNVSDFWPDLGVHLGAQLAQFSLVFSGSIF